MNKISTICTVFDKKYLAKALTMYESLLSNLRQDFVLHCLCIDDVSFNKINSIKSSNIKAYFLKDIEENNKDLLHLKNNIKLSKYGDAYSQYCWSLTPFFCNYILENHSSDNLLYIDSDIVFYEDFSLIEDYIGNKSIALVTHRTTVHLFKKTDVGKYNVGIVFFKKDETGIKCSRFWKDLLLNQENEYFHEYGTCGDQKYLELFEIKFGIENICILCEKIAHGAPWCFSNQKYLEKRKVLFFSCIQNVVFDHFSHFCFNENSWKSSYNNEWKPEDINFFVKDAYENYYISIKNTILKYNLKYEYI